MLGTIFIVQNFDSILGMTGGQNSTNIPYEVYEVFYSAKDYGVASALGVVVVFGSIIVATFGLRVVSSLLTRGGSAMMHRTTLTTNVAEAEPARSAMKDVTRSVRRSGSTALDDGGDRHLRLGDRPHLHRADPLHAADVAAPPAKAQTYPPSWAAPLTLRRTTRTCSTPPTASRRP